MSKAVWACPSCGQDFTRKTSAVRHIYNLHNSRILPVRYTDYLAGRQSGQYLPLIPARKTNTVANKSRGDISPAKAIESPPWPENIIAPSAATDAFRDPVAEAVRNFIEVKRTYNQICNLVQDTSKFLPSMNVINALPASIIINKPIAFRVYLCDLCLSGSVEAVSKFVEDGSLAKVNHTCNVELAERTKHLPDVEYKRKTLHEVSFRILTEVVNSWIDQDAIYLKAEELSPMACYEFGTGSGTKNNAANETPSSYVEVVRDLGDVNANHWAYRAINENKKRPAAFGAAVAMNTNELMEFLSIAKATFGVFQIKMPCGSTSNVFMYVVKGLEFTKANYLAELKLPKSNNNIRRADIGSKLINFNLWTPVPAPTV